MHHLRSFNAGSEKNLLLADDGLQMISCIGKSPKAKRPRNLWLIWDEEADDGEMAGELGSGVMH
jgi:hypothetical protein